ncbi:hypothetical protein PTT_04783, partial [Pyrenophora teres f. teres 0-1]
YSRPMGGALLDDGGRPHEYRHGRVDVLHYRGVVPAVFFVDGEVWGGYGGVEADEKVEEGHGVG